MSSEPGSGEGFVRLWPTVLVQRTLPDHEAPNEALARLIEGLEAAGLASKSNHGAAVAIAHAIRSDFAVEEGEAASQPDRPIVLVKGKNNAIGFVWRSALD